VGELAAGIAHEINNPITFVRSNLYQLGQQWQVLLAEAEKSLPDPSLESIFSEGEELIEESVEGVDRVTAIVREVSAFSRAGIGDSEEAELNELMDNAVNVAALRYPVMIERCYGDLPPVSCTPQHLKQVFLHLLLNAAQAVGESGRIRITTQATGGVVVVRVEDDGCGIPEDALERIFYATTEARSPSTRSLDAGRPSRSACPHREARGTPRRSEGRRPGGDGLRRGAWYKIPRGDPRGEAREEAVYSALSRRGIMSSRG
jgi:C4-dicarboxylate-specific signal transduction histidine kinase